jgi:hypothetical protein
LSDYGALVEAVEYRAQPRERVEGTMGSLRKFEALPFSEQPLGEPVQLLSLTVTRRFN